MAGTGKWRSRLSAVVTSAFVVLAMGACGSRTAQSGQVGPNGLLATSPVPYRMEDLSPTKVCGEQLAPGSAARPVVFDIAGGREVGPVGPLTLGSWPLLIKTSDSCDHGADFIVTPADAAKTVTVIRAKDGKPVAVALQPIRGATIKVSATVDGEASGVITVSVVSPSPS